MRKDYKHSIQEEELPSIKQISLFLFNIGIAFGTIWILFIIFMVF